MTERTTASWFPGPRSRGYDTGHEEPPHREPGRPQGLCQIEEEGALLEALETGNRARLDRCSAPATIAGPAFLILAGLAGWAGCAAGPPSDAPPCAVVESVEPGGAAARAGLRAGDCIAGWREGEGGAERGDVRSPIDLDRLETLRAPVGPVTLDVLREGGPLSLPLPTGGWRVESRPPLDADSLARQQEALRASGEELVAAVRSVSRPLWQTLLRRHRRHAALWVMSKASRRMQVTGVADEASVIHEEALEAAGADLDARLWLTDQRSRDLAPAEAEALFRTELEDSALPRLQRARFTYLLAAEIYRQGRPDEAQELAQAALELWRENAPGSLNEVQTAVLLAKIVRNRGELSEAARRLEELARQVAESHPGSRLQAEIANEQSLVSWGQGELRAAEGHSRQALTYYEELGVDGVAEAYARMGLGLVLGERGDYGDARLHFDRARATFEEHAPGTAFEAWSLQQLGVVDFALGDYPAAESALRRALETFRTIGSVGDVAATLGNLGRVADARGRREEAIRHFREALEQFETRYTGSEEAARVRTELGRALLAEGDAVGARELFEHALAWSVREAPGGLAEASALVERGRLQALEGDAVGAEASLSRAIRIRRRLTPGSAHLAEAFRALATLRRTHGRREDARELLEAAVAALEEQQSRLGGDREKATTFGARYAPIYRELLELLVELNEPEAAFGILERYRAQGLLAMLRTRDLLLDADLPEAVSLRRHALAREYEQTQERLAAVDSRTPPGDVEALLTRLTELRRRRAAAAAELLELSPRLARLTTPRAHDVVAAAAALDPGTLLLSYAVLAADTYLFALGGSGEESGLQVIRLGVGADALRKDVETFLLLMRSPHIPASRSPLERRGAALYERLVAPLEGRLQSARRLLVVPDGPLHALPFAALRNGSGQAGHLVERLPLHTAVSVTVYAELRGRREPAAGERRVLGFGDPTPSRRAGSVPAVPQRSPASLPSARREVEALRRLFPAAETFVGDAATERRVKDLARRARYLHFACHAAVDERFPLDSHLALAATEAGGDNGLLQAWEIFEELRLDAELVTLSACETGLGREVGGEGLVGLTRAFQYAGARSVVASLWEVSDRSTAILMERLYAELKQGRPKDEALRAAQLALLAQAAGEPDGGWPGRLRELLLGAPSSRRSADTSHPYYWAAFQLFGDWR